MFYSFFFFFHYIINDVLEIDNNVIENEMLTMIWMLVLCKQDFHKYGYVLFMALQIMNSSNIIFFSRPNNREMHFLYFQGPGSTRFSIRSKNSFRGIILNFFFSRKIREKYFLLKIFYERFSWKTCGKFRKKNPWKKYLIEPKNKTSSARIAIRSANYPEPRTVLPESFFFYDST